MTLSFSGVLSGCGWVLQLLTSTWACLCSLKGEEGSGSCAEGTGLGGLNDAFRTIDKSPEHRGEALCYSLIPLCQGLNSLFDFQDLNKSALPSV